MSKAIGKMVKHKEYDPETVVNQQHTLREVVVHKKAQLDTIPEKIAGNKFAYKNKFVAALKEAYPKHYQLHHVQFYFPYAQPQPLFVEYCKDDEEIQEAEKKAKILRKLGHWFLIMKPQMTMQDAVDQLEETTERPRARA